MRRLLVPTLVLLMSSAVGLAIASPASAATTTANRMLAALAVRSESNSPAYARTAFKHWIDADRDSCDTREEVLIAESTVTAKRGTGCRILSGKWYSYYDGRTWTNPSDVDIDHVVALKEAWVSGARTWSATNRQRYANDLGYAYTLQAVTDNVNSSKGDRDPAEWLPPRSAGRCTYAQRWVAVKYRWRLSVDVSEKRALSSLLAGSCGTKPITRPARAI
jgi:hypothetical protein